MPLGPPTRKELLSLSPFSEAADLKLDARSIWKRRREKIDGGDRRWRNLFLNFGTLAIDVAKEFAEKFDVLGRPPQNLQSAQFGGQGI